MNTGIGLIAQERIEQIEKHGFTSDHKYKDNELVDAAMQYLGGDLISCWPESWDRKWYKSENKEKSISRVEELKIAGALIAAEIDRLLSTE